MKRSYSLCTALLMTVLLFGCLPKSFPPDYAARASKIRTVGILAPDITVNDLHIGGVREKRDDWSGQANRNFVDTLTKKLSARGFELKLIARDGRQRETLEELSGLLSVIVYSYRMHAVGELAGWKFPHKADYLDYTVGPLDDLFDDLHVDALFLVNAYGEGDHPLMAGGYVASMALIDRSGTLMWLSRKTDTKRAFASWDIKRPEHVDDIVSSMMEKMPEVQK